MVDIQSATAEVRRGKKEDRRRRNHRAKIKSPHLLRRAAINRDILCSTTALIKVTYVI